MAGSLPAQLLQSLRSLDVDDYHFQMGAVVGIAVAFAIIGSIAQRLVKVFPSKKDNAQAVYRLVGFVHHFIQVPLAFYVLTSPGFWDNKITSYSSASLALMLISAGYFLHDFLHSLINVKEEGLEYVLHGGASLFVYLGALQYRPPVFHFYGAGFILWEVSSVFLHIGWFLHKLGKYTLLQFVNGATVLLTFFMFRLLWGPYLSLSFFYDTREPKFKHDVNVIICYIASIALNMLNCYWFFLLCRKAVRMAKGVDKDKDK